MASSPVTPDAAPTRTLVVVRHSKAEPSAPTDAERALAGSGVEDARALGRWCSAQGLRPDTALVSAARRAEQTWLALAEGAGWTLTPDLDPGLYTAGPDTALDLVRVLDPQTSTVVLVGHNPTMAFLAQLLDDGEGDADAESAMSRGFPTSACAVFSVEGAWEDLEPATARLAAFHVGRA